MGIIQKYEEQTLDREEVSRFISYKENIRNYDLNLGNFDEYFKVWDSSMTSISIQLSDIFKELEIPLREALKFEKIFSKEDKKN